MMEKVILLTALSLLNSIFIFGKNQPTMTGENSLTAASNVQPVAVDASGNTIVQRNYYLRIGTIESIKNDKYLLRQKSTEIEFYINNETKIFLTKKGDLNDINQGNYVLIRGPHNKKIVLANSVSVYKDKKLFNDFNEKSDYLIKGTITQKDPMIISIDGEGKDLRVEYDEDTYWTINKQVDINEIKIADRVSLYFDKVVTIRYKNYPVKITINRDEPED